MSHRMFPIKCSFTVFACLCSYYTACSGVYIIPVVHSAAGDPFQWSIPLGDQPVTDINKAPFAFFFCSVCQLKSN